MTTFKYVKPRSRTGTLTWSEVTEIADSLRQGALAVLPTETGYMLAALATSGEAVKAAFTVKGRAGSAVMHVACGSLEMAGTVGMLTDRAARLLGQLTPGPVSVIVRATGLLSDSASMVTLNGTVGLRIPDHPGTLQVINAVGSPLTATSLNSSGSQLASVDEADLQTMNWPEREVVYVVRDDAAITCSSASTLVRVSNDSVEILRDGPISESEIRRIADQPAKLVATFPGCKWLTIFGCRPCTDRRGQGAYRPPGRQHARIDGLALHLVTSRHVGGITGRIAREVDRLAAKLGQVRTPSGPQRPSGWIGFIGRWKRFLSRWKR